MLAAFVTPALFYGGAAAVSAPILIHLLARRRFKRIRWAAIEFLVDAQRRNRRRIRLEEWVLLALRCLAILFVALIVSRPYIVPSGLAAGLSGSRRTERIFVLDDSYSMAYTWGGKTSFDRAKHAVAELIHSIRTESPDDTVSLLRMSSMDEPVDAGTYLDDSQVDALLARVEALAPTQQSIDPYTVVESLSQTLKDMPDVIDAAVYLISDVQRHDWVARAVQRNGPSEPAGFLDPLASWMERNRGLHVFLINVGDADADNSAVTELMVDPGPLVAGTSANVRVTIANNSDRSLDSAVLGLTVGHLAQEPTPIEAIEPRQQRTMELSVAFLRDGYETLRVQLPTDALPVDNVRYLAAEVAGAVRVLLVNGEPSIDEYEDESFFLATALRPEGEVFSGNEVVVVDETELNGADLRAFDVVVLANVYHVGETAVTSLEQFVRRGGGLVVFLGDQVDPDFYNTALYRDGAGWLPASLGDRLHVPSASHLVVTERLHPAMRQLSREGDPLGIGQVTFREYYALEPTSSTEAADGGAGVAEPPVRSSAPCRVIARFDDADEHPAIIERPFGLGAVILSASAVDKEWNQWPDHPTYLPVMTELIRSVAGRGHRAPTHWVGSRIEVPVDPAAFDPDVIVRTPAYPNAREVSVTALPDNERDGLTAVWEQTDSPGFYEFTLRRREGGEITKIVAVNVDPREADLAQAREDELRKAAGTVPFEYIAGLDELAAETHEARSELWRLFLAAAVIVLMGEQFLAWRWGRRH